MTFRRRGYDNIQKKWAPIAKEDPIEALLAVEEDLGLLSVVRNYKWDDYLYSKLPTSNLPKNVKNAEMIKVERDKIVPRRKWCFVAILTTKTMTLSPPTGYLV